MDAARTNYFGTLAEQIGDAWNRFWFSGSDPFMLSVIRVLTGLVAMYTLVTYTFDLQRLFAADGLLPVETAAEWQRAGGQDFVLSYLYYVTEPRALWAVHIIGMVILALFTAGLFTRVTSVLALIVTLSYIHRAPMLTADVEPVLAMVQFYLCLGPSGAYWSLDRLIQQRRSGTSLAGSGPAAPSVAANIATRLIQLHLSAVYLMMALAKLGPVIVISEEFDFIDQPWWAGIAVWQLMSKPESRLIDLTGWFDGQEADRRLYMLNLWTHAVVLFELSFGLLIWNRAVRPLLLMLAVAMWTLLALILGDVAFCAMMLIASLTFVEPEMFSPRRA